MTRYYESEYTSPWEEWFAWHPVKIKKGLWAFRRTILRKKEQTCTLNKHGYFQRTFTWYKELDA